MKKIVIIGHSIVGVDFARSLFTDTQSISKEIELLKDLVPVRKARALGPSTTMKITNPYDDVNFWDIKPKFDPDLDFPEDWNTGKKTGMKFCSMKDQKRAKLRKKRKKRKR